MIKISLDAEFKELQDGIWQIENRKLLSVELVKVWEKSRIFQYWNILVLQCEIVIVRAQRIRVYWDYSIIM